MRSGAALLVFAASLFVIPSGAVAAPVTIDFEGLTDLTSVNTQLSNLLFTNTIAYVSGASLNEFETPPHSGSVAVSDDSGPISVVFAAPVSRVGGYFTYAVPLTLSAFDSAHNLLGSATSAFSSNFILTGIPGSTPNEFLQFVSTSLIASVTITGDPTGGSFVLDDLVYDATVPEPFTLALLAIGIPLAIGRRLKAAPTSKDATRR